MSQCQCITKSTKLQCKKKAQKNSMFCGLHQKCLHNKLEIGQNPTSNSNPPRQSKINQNPPRQSKINQNPPRQSEINQNPPRKSELSPKSTDFYISQVKQKMTEINQQTTKKNKIDLIIQLYEFLVTPDGLLFIDIYPLLKPMVKKKLTELIQLNGPLFTPYFVKIFKKRPQCQCIAKSTNLQCTQESFENSMFCQSHQKCLYTIMNIT